MERCKTCKHWQADEYYTGYNEGHEPIKRWGVCAIAKSYNGYRDQPQGLAYASDSESYAAQLITSETFGCMQWEERKA